MFVNIRLWIIPFVLLLLLPLVSAFCFFGLIGNCAPDIFLFQGDDVNGGVTQIVAGTNITIDPVSGVGVVTINSTGGGADGNAVGVTQNFDNSDLVLGVLTVDHNLNTQYPQVQVIDDLNELILPDLFTFSDVNVLIVDLNSFAPITSTWRVVLDASH